MNVTREYIESLVPWSEKKLVETRFGMKHIQTALPTQAFWDAWEMIKYDLKQAGVAVAKDAKTKAWMANWWTDPPEALKAKLDANIRQSTSVDALGDIVIPAPAGLEYRPYQRGAIAFSLGKTGTALCDEMGLGKTIEVIGRINIDPTIKKVIIVCPVSLKLNWYNELKKWLVRPMSVGIATPTAFPSYADIQIVGYSVVHRFTALYGDYDLAVLDEATYVKNRKTRRWAGVSAIKARIRIVVSGTPMDNNPQEMWAMLNWADPVGYDNYYKYVVKYCGAKKSGKGFIFNPTNQDCANLQRRLRETIMVRRLKSDVAKEIPPKTRSIIELECNDPAIRQELDGWKKYEPRFNELTKAIKVAKESGNDEEFAMLVQELKAGQSAAFEELAQVRRRVAEIKLPYVLEFIESQFVENRVKVVTFGHHRFMIESIAAKFGRLAVSHFGGMSEKEKWQNVQGFVQDPRILIFNGSLLASSMGITLANASNVLCYEYDWRPGIMAQAEDRCHRIGQVNPVNVHLLVLQDSLDAYQVKTYVNKAVVIGRALDGQ